MDVEFTLLTLAPKSYLGDDPHAVIGIQIDGDIEPDELADFKADINPSYWALESKTSETNWGASGSSAGIVLAYFWPAADQAMWLLIAFAIDRLYDRLSARNLPAPSVDDALRVAALHVLVAFENESASELIEIGDRLNTLDGTRSVVLQSPTHEYDVSVKLTPSGLPVVFATRRVRRPES